MVIPLIRYGVNDRLYIKLDAGGLYGTVYFQALLQQGSYAGVELAALIQAAESGIKPESRDNLQLRTRRAHGKHDADLHVQIL